MNYGLTAAAVLGALALSAPKEPQHNLMKLPSFKGILEVRASIPGRMRLYVPSLSGSMDQAEPAREQLLGTGVVQMCIRDSSGSAVHGRNSSVFSCPVPYSIVRIPSAPWFLQHDFFGSRSVIASKSAGAPPALPYLPTPFKYPLFEFSSVSSDSS